MLSVKEVRELVEQIKSNASDDECAHSQEDSLYAQVLQAIADDDCEDPKACAREALATEAIEFARWCA